MCLYKQSRGTNTVFGKLLGTLGSMQMRFLFPAEIMYISRAICKINQNQNHPGNGDNRANYRILTYTSFIQSSSISSTAFFVFPSF